MPLNKYDLQNGFAEWEERIINAVSKDGMYYI